MVAAILYQITATINLTHIDCWWRNLQYTQELTLFFVALTVALAANSDLASISLHRIQPASKLSVNIQNLRMVQNRFQRNHQCKVLLTKSQVS